MKLLIDSADTAKIREICACYPVDGVTTNPSILAGIGRNPYEVLGEIRSMIGAEAELHVQAVSAAAEAIAEEAHVIYERVPGNTFVKIPATPQGLRAMKLLHAGNHRITATAIYTPMQAFLAAKAGANYAAPYVNRIDNLGANGVETVRCIHDIFKSNGLPCEVIAASFKNSQQVLELCRYGIGAAAISPGVIENLMKNACVDAAVDAFAADFAKLCGADKTMKNC